MKLIIQNGRILDPSAGIDAVGELWIDGDRITEPGAYPVQEADRIIDAAGKWVAPGLIDLHVHFRDPGFEYKETVETGSRAAVKGGFTSVCPMPNTKPVTDSGEMVDYVRAKAAAANLLHVLPVGAVTKGQQGQELADIEEMVQEGAAAISEDGKSVMNSDLYRDAMRIAAQLNIPVFAHCEDINLVHGGCINAGPKAESLGLPGISNSVEDVITARDIFLAKETGAQLHLCHCSTKDSVELVKMGKKMGVRLTAEVCPHHFSMSDDEILSADSNYKMNPPLRSREDVEALKEALRDGTMEVIATDHAPHHEDEKARPITQAPFGITGLETAIPLTITNLVKTGWISPLSMIEKMSTNPAKVLGLDKGSLGVGKCADVVLIDPDCEYVIDKNSFVSKGKNTPFHGAKVNGRAVMTIVDGR
ncbi:MAG: dihydroorotase, partial [Lachnospiraceae bacterium]|nr:dihydroorotase [Lachnospiraceae bacterium]